MVSPSTLKRVQQLATYTICRVTSNMRVTLVDPSLYEPSSSNNRAASPPVPPIAYAQVQQRDKATTETIARHSNWLRQYRVVTVADGSCSLGNPFLHRISVELSPDNGCCDCMETAVLGHAGATPVS